MDLNTKEIMTQPEMEEKLKVMALEDWWWWWWWCCVCGERTWKPHVSHICKQRMSQKSIVESAQCDDSLGHVVKLFEILSKILCKSVSS